MDIYLVYSIKMQAWVGISGGTSDYKHAKFLTEKVALEYCEAHRDHDGAPGAIPVKLSVIAPEALK